MQIPSSLPDLSPHPDSNSIREVFSAAGFPIPQLAVAHAPNATRLAGFRIRAEDAMEMWEHLRKHTEATGYYPLIIADRHGTLSDFEPSELLPVEETLEYAAKLNSAEWLKKRLGELQDGSDGVIPLPLGEWSEQPGMNEITVPFNGPSGGPLDDVRIVLIPTKKPWEALAYVAPGGWNEYPEAAAHVAVHRHWHDHYGAEPIAMSGDVIEMKVARAPATREAAEALAIEQFAYCSDIVYQGTDSIRPLASSLMKSTVWFFWWD